MYSSINRCKSSVFGNLEVAPVQTISKIYPIRHFPTTWEDAGSTPHFKAHRQVKSNRNAYWTLPLEVPLPFTFFDVRYLRYKYVCLGFNFRKYSDLQTRCETCGLMSDGRANLMPSTWDPTFQNSLTRKFTNVRTLFPAVKFRWLKMILIIR